MEVPPSEVSYEAVHISDDDRATVITAVVTSFFIASTAVVLRLISRRLKHRSLQHDDCAAIIALAFVAGLSANIGIDLYAGLARHSILTNHNTTFLKSITATQILYITGLVPARLSIVFYYRRLSTSSHLSVALWLLGIWIVVLGIAGNFLVIFNCANASTINIGARCVDDRAANLSYGGLDVLTNMILFCWPIQFCWSLGIDRVRTAHLVGVFALGGFACAASIIRLIYLNSASQIDPTWSITAPTIWSFVELSIGLAASCLATLTPLLRFILPRYSSSSSSSSYPSTSRRGRRRSFISDTETAIATPKQPTNNDNNKRTRTISFKDSPEIAPPLSSSSFSSPLSSSSKQPSPSISKPWRKKSSSKTKTGASSPGFTWRCSGRPEDLEKWKALPMPPVPTPPPPPPQALPPPALPEEAHVSRKSAAVVVVDIQEGNMQGPPPQIGPNPSPLFRPVVYEA